MSNANPDQTGLNRGGRPKGSRSKSTIAREAAAKSAAVALAEGLASETISNLSPLQVLLLVMKAQFQAGELVSAANIAALAAPYVHGRISPSFAASEIPADLLIDTDPAPTPDEPGPVGGFIH